MSWFNADSSIGSRLDKFLISTILIDFTDKCDNSPCCMSDHYFVNLCLNFKDLFPRGPGVWKFNNSLLNDDSFCEYISGRISDLALCKTSFYSVKSWWDFFKISLRAILFLLPGKSTNLSIVNAFP